MAHLFGGNLFWAWNILLCWDTTRSYMEHFNEKPFFFWGGGGSFLREYVYGNPSILDNVMLLCCMSADTQTHMCMCVNNFITFDFIECFMTTFLHTQSW